MRQTPPVGCPVGILRYRPAVAAEPQVFMSLKKIVIGAQTGVDRGALEAALRAEFPCGGSCRATVILFDGRLTHGHLTSGTRLTRLSCQTARKPLLVLDAAKMSEAAAAEAIRKFVNENGIAVLNVAGPRGSGWPKGFAFAFGVIWRVLKSEA